MPYLVPVSDEAHSPISVSTGSRPAVDSPIPRPVLRSQSPPSGSASITGATTESVTVAVTDDGDTVTTTRTTTSTTTVVEVRAAEP